MYMSSCSSLFCDQFSQNWLVEDRVERSENRVKRCRFDYGHTWFFLEIGPWEMLCHVI